MKTVTLTNPQHELLTMLLQRQYRNQKNLSSYYELESFHASEIGDGLEAGANEELLRNNEELVTNIRHLMYKLGVEVNQ